MFADSGFGFAVVGDDGQGEFFRRLWAGKEVDCDEEAGFATAG